MPRIAPKPSAVQVKPPSNTTVERPLRFIVGDHFSDKVVDLDGDGNPDVSHGQFTSTLVTAKSAEAGKTAVVEGVDATGAGGLTAMFDGITVKLRSGIKYDGINLSLAIAVPEFDTKGNASGAFVDVTPKTIAGGVYPNDTAKQAAFVLRANTSGLTKQDTARVRALFEKLLPKEMKAYKTMLAEASKRNVPVTVAKGNKADELNILVCYEPTIAVGSTGKRGATSAWSSKIGKTDAYEQGELNHTKVAGGIDINEDGKPDFTTSSLSGGPSTISGVLGKTYDSVKASGADYQTYANYYADSKPEFPRHLAGKVFDLKKLASMVSAATAKTQRYTTHGEELRTKWGTSNDYITFKHEGRKLVPQGVSVVNNKVVLDVTGKGGDNVVSTSGGTSWSAPTSMVNRAVLNAAKSTR